VTIRKRVHVMMFMMTITILGDVHNVSLHFALGIENAKCVVVVRVCVSVP